MENSEKKIPGEYVLLWFLKLCLYKITEKILKIFHHNDFGYVLLTPRK